MGFLDDYSDADPNHKSIRGNGITTFLFNVAQCILFCLKYYVKKILIANASLKTFYSRLGSILHVCLMLHGNPLSRVGGWRGDWQFLPR